MALALYDRVQETTTTSGTGSVTLAGAVSGYQSFAVVGNGNTCFYTIVDGSAWEVGLGTYSTTGPTLARTTVYANSNGNTSPITLSSSANTKSVFVTYPAEKSINYDANGVATIGSVLGYSDSGIIGSFASTVAGYNQVILQNKSSATTASTNFNVSNDAATATTGYAELGINSSTFVGSGSFNIAGASYLASASTDLTVGTYGAYNLHFVTNSNTTDAMTIFNDGGVSLGGNPDPGIGTLYANNIYLGFTTITAAAGTTVLTNASSGWQQVVGTTTQTIQLPVATTLYKGLAFTVANNSTGTVTIKDSASTTIDTVVTGGTSIIVLTANGTSAGSWVAYSYLPASYDFSTTAANFGGATISNATWNGSAIGGAYGGTGLTTFSAANNALYSTGTTTLTAGTLPFAAGGTGATSFTANYIPYVNGTNTALTSNIGLQFNGSYLIVGGTTPLGGTTNPITAFTGSANNYVQTYVYNANSGISGSADFVAYANNSTDTHGWADMGFTSSTYADSTYTVTGPNEAYLLGSAPSGAGATGNLVYATDNTGTANSHQWYVGGFTQAKSAWKMQLTSTGLQLANALATTYGGTGLTSFTSGGAVYATSTSALTTGTLPVTAGGTGMTTATANGVLYGNGTSAHGVTAAGTTGQVLIGNTGAAPSWGTISSSLVSSFSAGTTGFSPSTATTGAVTLSGILNVANGGTGNSSGQAASVANAHTAGTGLSGSTYNGSAAVTWNLANTTVTAGSYTNASLTVDAQGRLTAASSGTAPVTSVTGTAPVVSSGGATPAISMAAANGTTNGYLTSTDWTTFNNKLSTAVTSAVAGTGISVSGSTGAVTFTNSGVTSIVAGSGISVSGATGAVTVSSTASGATITGTTSAGTYYVVGTTSTSGTLSTASISNTNVVSYNASTGALSAVSHVSSSDERLKTDWVNLGVDFIDRLADVKHGTFERISSGNREVGVTAQSLKEVLPEAVVEDEEGYMSVNYGTAALVAAIELAKEVKALRAEIAALKAR